MSSKYSVERTKEKPRRARSVSTRYGSSEKRRKQAKRPFEKITELMVVSVKEGLKKYHSPEQIAGRLAKEGKKAPSHETV